MKTCILAAMVLISIFFAAGPLAAAPSNTNLVFTFNSAGNHWTHSELVALQSWTALMYPLIEGIYGPPAVSGTINIRKDPAGHWYDDSAKEIVIYGAIPDVLCHEMVHAFRGPFIIGCNAYEEGMTRAVEVAVMSQLTIDGYAYWDNRNSYLDDVWYEGHNAPPVSCTYGYFFAGSPLPLVRYQQAGYAWIKCLLEDPQFFSKFNGAYYAAASANSGLANDISKLAVLCAQTKATVEGKPFATWYAGQKIFDFAPAPGYQFFLREGEYFYAFYRDELGFEHPIGNAPASWEILDYRGEYLGSGEDVTSALGWIDLPWLESNYSGKINVKFHLSTPDGMKTASFDAIKGSYSGIFGIVPGTSGSVKITPPKGSSVTVGVENGAYEVPSFSDVAGTFTVSYIPATGGKAITKVITKNSSDYFVPLDFLRRPSIAPVINLLLLDQ